MRTPVGVRIRQAIADRGLRLAVALAVAVTIPVAVLFYVQFRALDAVEQTSSVVLRQLSQSTADTLAKSIEEALKRPYIRVLLRIPQSRTEPPDVAFIEPIFEESLRDSPFIEAFYLWSATAPDQAMYVVNRDSLEAPRDAFEQRFRRARAVERDFRRRITRLAAAKTAIVSFAETIGGRRKYVQAQLRFSSPAREALSSFVALVVDAGDFRDRHMPALLAARARSLGAPTGFPPLDVTLRDESGRVVFASSQPAPGTFVDERTFPVVFFDKELLEFAAPLETDRESWVLRTGYGSGTIEDIVRANTRSQRLLMALLALAMGIGVFFVAGAAAREVRLAELKSNFVASVSHDLKTPLALIQLFAETLELGRVRTAERAAEYYRIINGEARTLTRLIENILDFSRMEAGLRPYRMAPVALDAVVARVQREFDHQLTQGRFSVHVALAPDLPAVSADADAVAQALANLLGNAMKYSGTSRELAIEAAREGAEVRLSVQDHGIGIPRHELSRIFRKFYRVERELGGGPQGCGLGLAIVDHTMRGHGGRVTVDSTPGRGSTFTLWFPIPPAPAAPDGAGHETDSGHRGRAADAARPA